MDLEPEYQRGIDEKHIISEILKTTRNPFTYFITKWRSRILSYSIAISVVAVVQIILFYFSSGFIDGSSVAVFFVSLSF